MGRRYVRIVTGILTSIFMLVGPLAVWAGETGTVTGIDGYVWVTGEYPGGSERAPAAVIEFRLSDGRTVPVFCTDLHHNVAFGDEFVASDDEMDCRVKWLLIHYPPRFSGGMWPDRPDALDDRVKEMAARQAAVWYFSDNFSLVSPTDPEIIDRANVIIAAANAVTDPCSADAPNVEIEADETVHLLGEVVTLTVRLTQGGEPVADRQVILSTDFGTLDPAMVTTDEQGEATFTVTSAQAGVSQIQASAMMSLPVGTIFIGVNPNKQKLVLGEQTTGQVFGYRNVTWVEGGTVVAHVFNDVNMDGTLQDGEGGLGSWNVEIVGEGAKATDVYGNALWKLPAGTYAVRLTQKSGWLATTPIEQQVTLGSGEAVRVDFGQVLLPAVKIRVFEDNDLDGAYSMGDGVLVGWLASLFRSNGSQAAGWNQFTDGEGWAYFSNDPSRNPPDLVPGEYFGRMTLEDGWYPTTAISQVFTLDAGEVEEVYLGAFHPEPEVELVVTAGDTPDGEVRKVHDGDRVVYHYHITNAGNTYLADVQVTDSVYGSVCALSGLLAPGASATCELTRTVDSDVTNTGTVRGNPVLSDGSGIVGIENVSDDDDAMVDVIHPGVEVRVEVSPGAVHSGEVVTWTVRVVNSGDDVLSGVVVSDTAGYDYGSGFELAVGEEKEFQYTSTPGGDEENEVRVVGEDTLGGTVEARDSAAVEVIHPAIGVTITVLPDIVYSGEAVTWTVQVVNTGNDDLDGVTLADSHGYAYGDAFSLSPTAERVFVYSTVPALDFTNVVTSSGVDTLGGDVRDSDTASVKVLPRAVVTLQVNPTGIAEPGGEVEFSVVVENPGLEAVMLVSLMDNVHSDLNGVGDCTTGGVIAPGESYACSFTDTVLGDAGDVMTRTV